MKAPVKGGAPAGAQWTVFKANVTAPLAKPAVDPHRGSNSIYKHKIPLSSCLNLAGNDHI